MFASRGYSVDQPLAIAPRDLPNTFSDIAASTLLANLCTDAFRSATKADIGFSINGLMRASQRTGSISMPLLVTMVFWLSLIFAAWGVFSPRNLVVATALFACAPSVSGAVLLILEMDQPLSGWIRVSPIPMQKALPHLGERR